MARAATILPRTAVTDGVSVLLNRGDGTFKARDYDTGHGRTPRIVAIGDLNGDGRPDLATATRPSGRLRARQPGRRQLPGKSTTRNRRLSLGRDRRPERRRQAGSGDCERRGEESSHVLINTPGLCTVQDVSRAMTPAAAKRTLARANCRVGKIRRAYSKVKRGRVISQKPRFGAVLPGGGKVNLVVSRGRRPS